MFLVGGWGLGRDVGFEQRLTRLLAEKERAQLLSLQSAPRPALPLQHAQRHRRVVPHRWRRRRAAVLKLSQMLRTCSRE
jgi:two-component system sensor histidine kinase AlgZ